MAKSEVKYGAILSYILIIANAFYGFVITPYILSSLGEAEYGVYKTISSFTASLMVLDLGIGSTMMRYIAKFRADKEGEKIPNYIAMSMVQGGVICVLVGVISAFIYPALDLIYENGLTTSEFAVAQKLYTYLIANILLHIVENIVNGIITGYNQFIVGNGVKILRLLARAILLVVLLNYFKSSIVLVAIDIVLTIVLIIFELLYAFIRLKVKVKLTYWDNALFKESFKYTLLLFITSIAAQINNNLDNVVIGALISSGAVAVYSMGLLIFGMFEQFSTAISGVMLPTITNSISTDDERLSNTQKIVVQAGRIQFMLLGAVLIGFIILGKPFINSWLGKQYSDVYVIALILMVPSLLELCVNVCLSILRAKNVLGFRTCILLTMTVLNAVITVVGTYFWNYYAAAIGTGFSFLVGSVIIMNIYYHKKFGFNMFKIYTKIFDRIWICLLISGVCCLVVSLLFESDLLKLVAGICTFVIVYAITLLVFGLNKNEKQHIFNIRRNNKW